MTSENSFNMACLVLIGGVIGCGKTSLINFLKQNKNELLCRSLQINNVTKSDSDRMGSRDPNINSATFLTVLFDDLCSIEEQATLMKTYRGWRNFRVDLLMAAEHFISLFNNSGCIMFGPLSRNSFHLLEKLKQINSNNESFSNLIILVEDNFYYRSMRYDWFQIAKRAHLGFFQVFLHCDLNTAIQRNNVRGYQIPEEKIKKMFSFLEYPDPTKYKWEKYFIKYDSTAEFTCSSVKPIIDIMLEACCNPAEIMVCKDKIEAQEICSKNVVHQTDKILRKIITKKINELKGSTSNEEELKHFISCALNVRQDFLNDLRQGAINIPEDTVDKIKFLGIHSIEHEFTEIIIELFDAFWNLKFADAKLKNMSLQ